jgi:hypothetical protein
MSDAPVRSTPARRWAPGRDGPRCPVLRRAPQARDTTRGGPPRWCPAPGAPRRQRLGDGRPGRDPFGERRMTKQPTWSSTGHTATTECRAPAATSPRVSPTTSPPRVMSPRPELQADSTASLMSASTPWSSATVSASERQARWRSVDPAGPTRHASAPSPPRVRSHPDRAMTPRPDRGDRVLPWGGRPCSTRLGGAALEAGRSRFRR